MTYRSFFGVLIHWISGTSLFLFLIFSLFLFALHFWALIYELFFLVANFLPAFEHLSRIFLLSFLARPRSVGNNWTRFLSFVSRIFLIVLLPWKSLSWCIWWFPSLIPVVILDCDFCFQSWSLWIGLVLEFVYTTSDNRIDWSILNYLLEHLVLFNVVVYLWIGIQFPNLKVEMKDGVQILSYYRLYLGSILMHARSITTKSISTSASSSLRCGHWCISRNWQYQSL